MLVIAAGDLRDPFLMGEIPLDGADDAILKRRLRLPTQLAAYLVGVNGITLVMPQPVTDKGYETLVHPIDGRLPLGVTLLLLQDPAKFRTLGHEATDSSNGRTHDVDVLPLIVPAYIINRTGPSLPEHQIDGLAMILDIEPVAHVRAVA